MKYYRNLYIDNNYKLQLVLSDDIIVNCYTNDDVLIFCNNGAITKNITIDGKTFTKTKVKSIYFGNLWDLDYIPDNFGYYYSPTHISDFPENIHSIGNNFFQFSSFNQPLNIPNLVTSIGNSFMYQSNYNSLLTLPDTLTSIGSSFLRNCYYFKQPLTLPSSLTSIGNGFMHSCKGFTGPLEILFTDPKIFTNNNLSLATTDNTVSMYTTGITITGNMTGAQLKTRLPNSTSNPFRKILD